MQIIAVVIVIIAKKKRAGIETREQAMDGQACRCLQHRRALFLAGQQTLLMTFGADAADDDDDAAAAGVAAPKRFGMNDVLAVVPMSACAMIVDVNKANSGSCVASVSGW